MPGSSSQSGTDMSPNQPPRQDHPLGYRNHDPPDLGLRGLQDYRGLHNFGAEVFSVTLILCGLSCIILQTVYYVHCHKLLSVCLEYGIPQSAGLLFIATGAMGCIASRKKTLATVITFMVLSILAVLATVPLVFITVVEAFRETFDVLDGLMMGAAILVAAVALNCAVYCCRCLCNSVGVEQPPARENDSASSSAAYNRSAAPGQQITMIMISPYDFSRVLPGQGQQGQSSIGQVYQDHGEPVQNSMISLPSTAGPYLMYINQDNNASPPIPLATNYILGQPTPPEAPPAYSVLPEVKGHCSATPEMEDDPPPRYSSSYTPAPDIDIPEQTRVIATRGQCSNQFESEAACSAAPSGVVCQGEDSVAEDRHSREMNLCDTQREEDNRVNMETDNNLETTDNVETEDNTETEDTAEREDNPDTASISSSSQLLETESHQESASRDTNVDGATIES